MFAIYQLDVTYTSGASVCYRF